MYIRNVGVPRENVYDIVREILPIVQGRVQSRTIVSVLHGNQGGFPNVQGPPNNRYRPKGDSRNVSTPINGPQGAYGSYRGSNKVTPNGGLIYYRSGYVNGDVVTVSHLLFWKVVVFLCIYSFSYYNVYLQTKGRENILCQISNTGRKGLYATIYQGYGARVV